MPEHDDEFFGRLGHLLVEARLCFHKRVLRAEKLVVLLRPSSNFFRKINRHIRAGDLRLIILILDLAEPRDIIFQCVVTASEDTGDRVKSLNKSLQWIHLSPSNPPLDHREVVLIQNLDCGRKLGRLVRMFRKQRRLSLLGSNSQLLSFLEFRLCFRGIIHGIDRRVDGSNLFRCCGLVFRPFVDLSLIYRNPRFLRCAQSLQHGICTQ